MDNIRTLLKIAGTRYNKSLSHYDACIALIQAAHSKLQTAPAYAPYGRFSGNPPVDYHVFSLGNVVSRPARPDIYIFDNAEFSDGIRRLSEALINRPNDLTNDDAILANKIVYTSVMSVACCYDLWQRGSRKTPGTFFEILMAALLQKMLPAANFTKHIPLAALLSDSEVVEGISSDLDAADEDEEDGGSASVSTDLVITMPGRDGGVVIPLKMGLIYLASQIRQSSRFIPRRSRPFRVGRGSADGGLASTCSLGFVKGNSSSYEGKIEGSNWLISAIQA